MASATLSEQLDLVEKKYRSGITKSYTWRRNKLLQLKALVLQHEQDIYDALYKDLHKSKEEVWATELGILLAEINFALKHLKAWMQPKRAGTNLVNLPSSSYIYTEPLGVVLIIGPWNYPFMLLMSPFVGALAAGNTVVLKPSEFAPATAALLHKMISSGFDPSEVFLVEGDGAVVVPEMMQQFTFGHVFFTGGTAIGKIIYEMAASKLVPVTLELGGKSPCVVEADANISVAARRIAGTKFSNAGQMCIAPDYILVHESVKDKLVLALKKALTDFFSANPEENENYGRIINDRQFNRLVNYLQEGHIIHGGELSAEKKYIAPTLMDQVKAGAAVMKEEIFGPILPILTFSSQQEALDIIAQNPNPLSFYVFTNSVSKEEAWIEAVSFGGGCVNNSSWHFANPHLPFGGRGKSGLGAAHGKASFDCFTHYKSVMKTPTWFDPSIKYPPYKGKLSLFKKLIR
nr:aldehyde dehydrogenase [Flavihumibacter fluvii]